MGRVARRRSAGWVLCTAVVWITLATSTGAAAQDGEPAVPEIAVLDDGEAAEAAEGFDGRATEATVDRVRYALVGIAALTAVGLGMFWWHTSPSRRLRVATQRAADNAATED